MENSGRLVTQLSDEKYYVISVDTGLKERKSRVKNPFQKINQT